MTEKPGSFLTHILDCKRTEIAQRKIALPLDALIRRAAMAPPVRNFAAALRKEGSTTLIAEVKKASPSRGVLLENFDHLQLGRTYIANGAAALSILTDEPFFQGSLAYLEAIRHWQQEEASADPRAEAVPLLRKDFLLDRYQVYEARANGADAVLLIVAALDDSTLQDLLDLVDGLGMHALVEVHTEDEMRRALEAGARVVGVNNRNLHTFTTHLETTEHLAALLPTGPQRPVLVSESGIHTSADIARLRGCGVDAILVGEALVTAADPGARVRELALA
ncbi:MAG: indole-3-glycerol phosphate synthase TrpC [Chloroflexaceae bacterium]|nr:indole-3-glycerol phosphate synthase TrpC [Chloroflexaceae bacterium]